MKTALPAFLSCLLLVFLSAAPAPALEPGTPAPDFKLSTLDGKKVSLSDFRGRIILLKLATTWCPSCKQQDQEIAEIGDFLKEREVVLVEVFLQDSEAMIQEHLRAHHFPMQHVVLEGDNKVAKAYNVYVIPRLLVIDHHFKVRRDGSLISAYDLKRQIEEVGGAR